MIRSVFILRFSVGENEDGYTFMQHNLKEILVISAQQQT